MAVQPKQLGTSAVCTMLVLTLTRLDYPSFYKPTSVVCDGKSSQPWLPLARAAGALNEARQERANDNRTSIDQKIAQRMQSKAQQKRDQKQVQTMMYVQEWFALPYRWLP